MKSFFTFAHTCRHLSRVLLVLTCLVGGGIFALAQKELPYSYDFEEKDLSTEGWTSYNLYNGGASYNVSQRNNSSSYAHSSSYSFRFYGYNSTTQYLISPEIETSTTGIVVSFYCYAPAAGNAQTRTFSVGYSTTDATYTSFDNFTDYSITFEKSSTAEWKLITTTIDATDVKYVAIKYTHSSTSYFDDFSFDKQTPYKTPTNFALSSFGTTSATFSWTAGNSETTWQFDYSTNPDFTPGSGINGTSGTITANPYTLSGLTTGTTYYASIRADYGNDNYSEWTGKVSFTPRAEVETTINDGSGTSSYVPIYGSGANSTSNASQFILPSSQLSGVSGRQITKIVLHTTSTYASRNWGKAEWEVYMNEVAVTSFSTQTLMAFGTKVFNAATLSVSNQELSITLDTPFNYNGGNLLIGFKTTKADASNWCTFYGVTASSGTNNGLYGTSSLSYQSFYPKMTITSVPITTDPVQMGVNGYTTFASPRALDLANLPDGLKAYKAQVVNDRVKFTEIDQAVPANTGMLLEGTAGTTYNIPVAESSSALGDNEFLVNSTGGTFTGDANSTYYGLVKATTAEEKPVFGTFDPSTVAIPSNKAYLKVSTEAAARLTCWFDSETTGIGEAQRTISDGGATTVFDLQGRRVAVGDSSAERTQLPKGVYIVNGRKVVVK